MPGTPDNERKREQKVLIVTGGDAAFFDFLNSCVRSIVEADVLDRADLGLLDLGLTAEQFRTLAPYATHVVRPKWTDLNLNVPERLQQDKHLGLAARPFLRELFPGYDIYIWFDADAWAQTSNFLDVYVAGAMGAGLAVAREDGAGYTAPLIDRRWWIGNYGLAFGIADGVRGALLAKSINIGILAIHVGAPHWEAFGRRYQQTIDRTGKINLDQHACHAALALEGLTAAYVPALYNWLPTLSTPIWNDDLGRLCDPSAPATPLSIIHLAGHQKTRPYRVKMASGGTQHTPLTRGAVSALLPGPHTPLLARQAV